MSLEIGSDRGVGIDPLDALAARIRSKEATVAVVGLGYVGLPLLIGISEAGYRTVGLDSDPAKVESLRAKRSYIVDVTDSEIAGLDRSDFSADPAALAEADVMLICVPTPLTDHTPDLTLVKAAAEDIGRQLKPGRLVILESTTYPGTTEELVRPALEASGLRAGVDFALGYSPERIDPGQKQHRLGNTPKIVSGLTDRCRELVTSFYGQFVREVVATSSPREAEMSKLIENTFRQVNIALVNELAIMARDLGVDIWDALQAASTKPFGYMPFWPGPGVGGHCIAIDPSYLSWRAGQKLGHGISFIEHANEVNNRMPDYVVSRLSEALNDAGKPIRGSKICALGIAYKAGVNDLRESPALAVLERLARKGAVLSYFDPFIEEIAVEDLTLRSQEPTEGFVAGQDCVIVLTSHRSVDYRMIARVAPLVFDTRGVTAGLEAPNVVRL